MLLGWMLFLYFGRRAWGGDFEFDIPPVELLLLPGMMPRVSLIRSQLSFGSWVPGEMGSRWNEGTGGEARKRFREADGQAWVHDPRDVFMSVDRSFAAAFEAIHRSALCLWRRLVSWSGMYAAELARAGVSVRGAGCCSRALRRRCAHAGGRRTEYETE